MSNLGQRGIWRLTERQLTRILIALIAITTSLAVLNAFHSTEFIPSAWKWLRAHDLPSGWAALIGAIVGLGAIAFQTRRGFRNLIASQQHQADLDRRAMHERAEVERDARIHQADIQAKAAREARSEEAKVFAAALQGELLAASGQHSNLRVWLLMMHHMMSELGKGGGKITMPVAVPSKATPVYDAGIAKVGSLGASVACDVAQVYSILKTEIQWTNPEGLDATLLASLLEGLAKEIPNQVDDILHVCKRLMAFERGTDDPGILAQRRSARAAKKDSEAAS